MANLPPTHVEWSQTQSTNDQEKTSRCPGDATGPQASAEPEPSPCPPCQPWSHWVRFPVACSKHRTHVPPEPSLLIARHLSSLWPLPRPPLPLAPAPLLIQIQHSRTWVPAPHRLSACGPPDCLASALALGSPSRGHRLLRRVAPKHIGSKARSVSSPSLNVIIKHCSCSSPFCLLSFPVCEFFLIQITCETRV